MSKRKPDIEVPDNKAVFSLRIVEIRAEEMREKREVTQVDPDKETGPPIVFDFIFDASGSMAERYGELADCFNTITIPSLREAAVQYTNPLRVGCLLFSNELVPAWRGFKTLEELGDRPMNAGMFRQPGLGGNTALFRAMESGVEWTAAAMKLLDPDNAMGKIAVLTDGANNQEPMSPQGVANIMGTIQYPKSFKTSIAYFKTGQGLSYEQFREMAAATKFEGVEFYEIAPKGNDEEQRRQFRHHFGIFSKKQTNAIKG